MKILIIHEVDWLKKVSYEIHHLSELFSLRNHDVYAIDVPDPGKMSFSKENQKTIFNYHRIYDNASVTIFRTPTIPIKGINRISAYLTSKSFIKKILQKYAIDAVLIYSIVTNAKAATQACNEMNVPIIHRTFDVIHDLIRENFLRSFVSRIEKTVYPHFDKVIANTPHMESWSHEMGAKNVVVVPQGVDPNIMKPTEKDKLLQKSLGFSDTDVVVMSLGSIESFSGLDSLIDKVPKILDEITDFKLLIVGGGADLDNLKQQTKSLSLEDKIVFTGYVPYLEVPKYCSLAKLCLNTFRITDMTRKLSPVKIFDMLSCGKVVISTPLDGLLHDFPKESNTVIYCDLEKFDQKIIEILKNDSISEIGHSGREYIETNFTWDKITTKMLDEISEMIDKK